MEKQMPRGREGGIHQPAAAQRQAGRIAHIKNLERRYEDIKNNKKARLAAVCGLAVSAPASIAASLITGNPNIAGGIATAVTSTVYLPITHKILKEKQVMGPSIPAFGFDTVVTANFADVGFMLHPASLPLIVSNLACVAFAAPAIPLVFSQQLKAAYMERQARNASTVKRAEPGVHGFVRRRMSDPVARFYAASITPFLIAGGTVAASIAAHAPSYVPGAVGTAAAPFVYLCQTARTAKLMKRKGLDVASQALSPGAYAYDSVAQSNWLTYAAMKNIPTLIAVQLAIMAGWVYPFAVSVRKMTRGINSKITGQGKQ